jgi:hypothetical protein
VAQGRSLRPGAVNYANGGLWIPRTEKPELARPAPGELIYALGMVKSIVNISFCTCFHRFIRSKVYLTGDPVGA